MQFRALIFFAIIFSKCLFAQSWVASVNPSQYELNVPEDSEILISFTQDIEPTSLTNVTIRVYGSLSGLFQSSNITYDNNTRTATFTPDREFKPGEVMNISVTREVMNASNVSMPEAFSWQFTAVALAGTAALSQSSNISVSSVPYSITIGDWDGDDDLDLATANRASNNVSILFNNGFGAFNIAATVAVGNVPEYVKAGDFDADGDLDLAIVNSGSNTISILINDGAGNFSQGNPVAVLNSPHAINSGDLDGDGDVDLIASNFNSAKMSVLMNDGSGNFSQSSAPNVGNGPELGIIADIDLDGDFDIAVPNFRSGDLFVLKNDGFSNFSNDTTFNTGSSPHLPASGDLDGDGDLDLVIPNSGSGTIVLLLNNGDGSFSQRIINSSGGPWSGATPDLDGDGDLDLVITKYTTNRIAIFINDGDANFDPRPEISVGINPHLVVAGDLDGNGTMDLAVTNDGSNSVTILKNDLATSVEDKIISVPKNFTLHQNYPNPFNPSTTIEYNLPKASNVVVKIYNITGKEIRTPIREYQRAGVQTVVWDGKNDKGKAVATGVYLYEIRVDDFSRTKKMILLR